MLSVDENNDVYSDDSEISDEDFYDWNYGKQKVY